MPRYRVKGPLDYVTWNRVDVDEIVEANDPDEAKKIVAENETGWNPDPDAEIHPIDWPDDPEVTEVTDSDDD